VFCNWWFISKPQVYEDKRGHHAVNEEQDSGEPEVATAISTSSSSVVALEGFHEDPQGMRFVQTLAAH